MVEFDDFLGLGSYIDRWPSNVNMDIDMNIVFGFHFHFDFYTKLDRED